MCFVSDYSEQDDMTCQIMTTSKCLYTVKNICISKDILWRVFHILTKLVPYMFVSVNQWNSEAQARITRHKISVDVQIYIFYSVESCLLDLWWVISNHLVGTLRFLYICNCQITQQKDDNKDAIKKREAAAAAAAQLMMCVLVTACCHEVLTDTLT